MEKMKFTLVEMLVVIGVIALLMTLLLPALKTAKDSAYTIKCKAGLKQIGAAIYSYGADYNGYICLNDGGTANDSLWARILYRDYNVPMAVFVCPVTAQKVPLKMVDSLSVDYGVRYGSDFNTYTIGLGIVGFVSQTNYNAAAVRLEKLNGSQLLVVDGAVEKVANAVIRVCYKNYPDMANLADFHWFPHHGKNNTLHVDCSVNDYDRSGWQNNYNVLIP